MRLRDVSEMVRELLEGDVETLMSGAESHALVQDIANLQTIYRPIAASSNKKAGIVQWVAFSFEPFAGLIEPFKVCPGRFWALLRMHRQSSGLPELAIHIARDLPSASEQLAPDLYVSFSRSDRIEPIVEQSGKDPISLRFFHKGAMVEPDGTRQPAEDCLALFAEPMPEGYIEDAIPGLVERNGVQMLYLGDITLYNQGRTIDRRHLCNFLLNCTAVAVVGRYARDRVRKARA